MLAPPQPNRNMSTLNCEYYTTQQTESSTCQRYWLNTYIKVTWFHQQTQITVGKYIVHTQHTRRSEIPTNIIKANMKPHLIPDLTNHFKQWYSDNACTVHNRKINCQQCSLEKWIFPVNSKKSVTLIWYMNDVPFWRFLWVSLLFPASASLSAVWLWPAFVHASFSTL